MTERFLHSDPPTAEEIDACVTAVNSGCPSSTWTARSASPAP